MVSSAGESAGGGVDDAGRAVERAAIMSIAAFAALAALDRRRGSRDVAPGAARSTNERPKTRHDFEQTLQSALEMSRAESTTYTVVNKALRHSVPRLQVEMLVADSSRAHFPSSTQDSNRSARRN